MKKDFQKFSFKDQNTYFYDENIIYNLAEETVNTEYGKDNLTKIHPEIDIKNISENKKEQLIEEQFEHDCLLFMANNIIIKEKKDGIFIDENSEMNLIKNFSTFPQILYQNIVEWINNDDISSIQYDDFTIPELLKMLNWYKIDDKKNKLLKDNIFVTLLCFISEYQKGELQDKIQIYRFTKMSVFRR